MATNAPKITINSLVAAKVETTTGTAESLTGTDASLICRNASLQPNDTYVRRERIGGQGNIKGVPGPRTGTFTGQFEAVGSGTDGTSPAYALAFFPACNLVESTGIWTPTTGAGTVTIGMYQDGKLKILYGARGDLKLIVAPGEVPVWEVSMQGLYNELTDTALLSPTFPTVLPDLTNRTFTINSYAAVISRMEIAMNNVVGLREDAGNTSNGGIRCAKITNRDPMATFDPEETATGTIDWDALYEASSEHDFSYQIGSTAGNVIQVTSTTAQVRKRPNGNRDGVLTRDIEVGFNEAAATAPFTITFDSP